MHKIVTAVEKEDIHIQFLTSLHMQTYCDFRPAGSKVNLLPLSNLQGDGEDTDMVTVSLQRSLFI